jgi:hypothetical protein
MDYRIGAINRFTTGWMAYFRLADVASPFRDLDGWLRRRLRQIHWKHWKTAAARRHNLRIRGISERNARQWAPKTWNRLFGKRRQADCKVLADMAKSLLDGKKALHDLIGSVTSRVAGWMGGKGVECAVVRQLAQRIPIPAIDQKTIVVARGLQMIGILLCISQGIPLNRCQSFIDLALAETKERVKQILVAAMDDWTSPSPTLLTPLRARAH